MVAAISSIDDTAWTPIRYPNAVFDSDEQRWISDAEVAETPLTAFTSRRKAEHPTGRLIVRRVRRLNTGRTGRTGSAGSAGGTGSTDSTGGSGSGAEQGELFASYRYHAVFTDSPLVTLQAETTHRAHAIVEQVIADLRNGPLAHLPSGTFTANAAWLALAAIAFNLTRAAGCLASTVHARATTGTLRAQLINVPARLASSARRLVLHLPQAWPWQHAFEQLFTGATGPPPATAV